MELRSSDSAPQTRLPEATREQETFIRSGHRQRLHPLRLLAGRAAVGLAPRLCDRHRALVRWAADRPFDAGAPDAHVQRMAPRISAGMPAASGAISCGNTSTAGRSLRRSGTRGSVFFRAMRHRIEANMGSHAGKPPLSRRGARWILVGVPSRWPTCPSSSRRSPNGALRPSARSCPTTRSSSVSPALETHEGPERTSVWCRAEVYAACACGSGARRGRDARVQLGRGGPPRPPSATALNRSGWKCSAPGAFQVRWEGSEQWLRGPAEIVLEGSLS